MAINSKTRIGGDSGEQSDRMIRAAAQGAQIQQGAFDSLQAARQAKAATVQQGAQTVLGAEQFNRSQEQQEGQFTRAQAQQQGQFEERLSLEAADKGLQRNDRAARLEQEMQRGAEQSQLGPIDQASQDRLREQGAKPMEMDSQGRWAPTEERKQEQKIRAFKADTERMQTQAYQQQVAISAQKALATGDKDAYEENAKRLANIPNSSQVRFDRLMKGDVNDGDWSDLESMAQGGPEADPSLMKDIKAKQFTPRVAAFSRAMIAKDTLQSIVFSRGDTNSLKVDWTNPKLREFAEQRNSINDFMRSNPAMSQLAFIKSTEDKMRFLNVLAAAQVLNGMTQAPSPSGGMTPATQAPQAQTPAPAGEMAPQAQAPQQQDIRAQRAEVSRRQIESRIPGMR